MRKYIVVLLVLILIFTASCVNKEKEELNLPANNIDKTDDNEKSSDSNNQDNNTKDENKESDDWLIEVYKGIYITEGDNIYYISDDFNKLYSIKKDGSEKALIHEQERMFQVQIYNNKLYVYSLIYTDSTPSLTVIPGKIVTMNKDGSEVKELDLGIDYTTTYYPASFWIYDDFLFLSVNNFDVPYDGMNNPVDYYKYDLKSGSLVNIHNNIDAAFAAETNGDFLYYYIWVDGEYILYKFNIYTGEKSSICINKRLDQSEYIYSDFYIEDNYIYYHCKSYIGRDKLDGSSDTEVLFELEEDKQYIVDLYLTDKYIFYIVKDDSDFTDSEDAKSKISVYRMNRDITDKTLVFSETQYQTNIAPQNIRVSRIYDDILIYENRHTNKILFLDLDGNILTEY